MTNKYGEIIRKKRMAMGLYQDELGEKINVSGRTISSWERGRTEPNMEMVARLADVFGCTLSDMVGREEDLKFLVDINSRADLEIIQKLGQLDHEDKLKILGRIEAMLESEKYR